MSTSNEIFDLVETIDRRGNAEQSDVRLRGSSATIRIPKKNKHHDYWMDYLVISQKEGNPVLILLEKSTGEVQEIFWPDLRGITEVRRDDAKGCLVVTMLPSPGIYSLRFSHPRFSEIEKVLRRALADKTRAYVTTGVDPLEIIDVHSMQSVPDSPAVRR